jgi:hypothetical protein
MRDALCVEYPDRRDDWFPASGRGAAEATARAKVICRSCLCQAECLAFAIREGITDGLWGGASPGERRKLVADGFIDWGHVERYGHKAVQGREYERERYRDALWEKVVAERIAATS